VCAASRQSYTLTAPEAEDLPDSQGTSDDTHLDPLGILVVEEIKVSTSVEKDLSNGQTSKRGTEHRP
jgi:hypothetical protein